MRARFSIVPALFAGVLCLAPSLASPQNNPLAGGEQNRPPAGTPPANQAPPTTQQLGPPALRLYSPSTGAQGTSVTLSITGANFRLPVSLQFASGAGLTVSDIAAVSPNQIQATLKIDASAPLGPRQVLLIVADHLLQTAVPFTVTGGQQPCTGANIAGVPCPPAGGQPPRPKPEQGVTILRVTPNQIPAGSQNVELKLEGTNFAPGAVVNFAAVSGGIANVYPQGGTRYVNSTEIHVVVNVLATAVPGGRDVSVTDPNHATGTGKGLLNITAPAPVALKPITGGLKLVPISPQHFTEAKIFLDDPKWGDRWEGEFENHYGMPLLNDDTVFDWQEQNPGLADYFELRIFARDGKTLLAKKRIDGKVVIVSGNPTNVVPTHFRPDPAFLADLLAKVPPPATRLIYSQWNGVGKQKKPLPPSPPSSATSVNDGDMQWEVAGFRSYNKNSVVKSAMPTAGRGGGNSGASNFSPASSGSDEQADVEVEISDLWPLAAPQAPNGLDNCPSQLASGKGLQLTAVGDPSVIDKNGNSSDPTRPVAVRIGAPSIPAAPAPKVAFTKDKFPQVLVTFDAPPAGLAAMVEVRSGENGDWVALAGPLEGQTQGVDTNPPKTGRVFYRVFYGASNGATGAPSPAAELQRP